MLHGFGGLTKVVIYPTSATSLQRIVVLKGKYFHQIALDLTSCHDWVVSRVMPLMFHGPLIAQMVMSEMRQVFQIGLCMGMTRTGYNRRVFSLGTKQLLRCTFSQYSPEGMYLSAGKLLYILKEAVFPFGVFLCQYLSFLCYYYCFQNPCICLFLNINSFNYWSCWSDQILIPTSTSLLYLQLDPTLALFGTYKDPQKKMKDDRLSPRHRKPF